MLDIFTIIFIVTAVYAVPPSSTPETVQTLQDDDIELKYVAKTLAVQLEKWNHLFLTSLEPRISSSASSLASIDSNINHLQERAHVWDTFQLHVSAWNDQLASLDRKMDIISKAQEQVLSLEIKINSLENLDEKLSEVLNKLSELEQNIEINNKKSEHETHNYLFGEFTGRGVLTSVKSIEKKMDRLLIANYQKSCIKIRNNERLRSGLRCNISKNIEQLLSDMASKVDVVFDRIIGREEIETDNDYEVEDDYGNSGDRPLELKQDFRPKTTKIVKKDNHGLDDIMNALHKIENSSEIIIQLQQQTLNLISNYSTPEIISKIDNSTNDITVFIESVFNEQKSELQSLFSKIKLPQCPNNSLSDRKQFNHDVNKNYFQGKVNESCEDLPLESPSGVYVFGNFSKIKRDFNEKYCLIRDDGLWTIIQRRDNYTVIQDFSLSWTEYRDGFGELSRDFWLGNKFINQLTEERDMILRIELEDFSNNNVWAEYSTFKILSEEHNFQLIVAGYSGNASDSFLSHNNSLFSTYDRKNDQAPECCPCSESYGGGWWFNSCFESNLNGIYYKRPNSNGYFRGIIWETWLGNYSLKKTVMMVKPKGKSYSKSNEKSNSENEEEPFYEDP